jgi:ATP-dependent DNA helicase RecG
MDHLADYIRNTPGKSVAEITAALNIPQRTVERWLKKLKEQGEIIFSGSRKSGGYFASR